MVWGKPSDLVARNCRPLDSQNNLARTEARLGYRQAHSTDLRRSTSSPTRFALSRSARPRTEGLDQSQMGGNRDGKTSQVLLVDRRGTRSVGEGSGQLEPAVRCDQSGR